MNKTICFFNTAIPWGGGEKWHFETAMFLHKKGHKVVVVCNKGSALYHKLEKTAIPTFTTKIGNLSFLNPIKLLRLIHFFKYHKVNIVLLNLSRDVKTGGLAAFISKVNRKIYFKGSANAVRNSRTNRFIYTHIIDEILVNSLATKSCIYQNNKSIFNKDYVKIIPHGVNFEQIEKREFKPIYKRKGNEIVLLSLGRLEAEKNHSFLIDVAIQLKKDGVRFKLLIGGSGSLYEHLKNRVKANQLDDDVYFTGFVKNPKDFYKSGDVLLLPSLYEGFGFVIIEAAANKIPVVAFDNSSKPEIIKQNSTGILTPDNDVEKFSSAVKKLYFDRGLTAKMGENAYSFTKNLFSIDEINLKIEKYLTQGFDGLISAIVTTYNEEKNIENCLNSIKWADEILVIDSFSTDNTVALCEKFGARVLQRKYNFAADQKNWAIPQAKHPWIILLDADEMASPNMATEIKNIIYTRPKHTAFWIRRINYFLGKKVRFCGWQNDRVARFFHRDFHRYENKMVHEELECTKPFGSLNSNIIHYTTSNIDHYTEKIERYAHNAAHTYIKENKKIGLFNLYLKPAFKFLNSYFLRGGILDGKTGWIICKLRTRETWLKAKITLEYNNENKH